MPSIRRTWSSARQVTEQPSRRFAASFLPHASLVRISDGEVKAGSVFVPPLTVSNIPYSQNHSGIQFQEYEKSLFLTRLEVLDRTFIRFIYTFFPNAYNLCQKLLEILVLLKMFCHIDYTMNKIVDTYLFSTYNFEHSYTYFSSWINSVPGPLLIHLLFFEMIKICVFGGQIHKSRIFSAILFCYNMKLD